MNRAMFKLRAIWHLLWAKHWLLATDHDGEIKVDIGSTFEKAEEFLQHTVHVLNDVIENCYED